LITGSESLDGLEGAHNPKVGDSLVGPGAVTVRAAGACPRRWQELLKAQDVEHLRPLLGAPVLNNLAPSVEPPER
jgi:hypothetical protein